MIAPVTSLTSVILGKVESEVNRVARAPFPEYGDHLSRQVCLRYVMKHPVAFREYWTPKMSKRPYWHRYTFGPVLHGQDQGDSVLCGARAIGKSYAVLEPELVRHAVNSPGEETVITSFRKVHIFDRMERAIQYFEEIPFFKFFLERVVRSPIYIMALKTKHMTYGASVGDDVEARTVQGKHASLIIIEEAHQYPKGAFQKLKGAQDPRGCRLLMAGVPDGRLDSPFRHADERFKAFAGRRFRISRRTDPFFTQKDKLDFVETFDGEGSDKFLQEVDAEWGHPTWAAWNIEAITRCIDLELPLVFLKVSGRRYRDSGETPEYVLSDLEVPVKWARRRLAADVGYTEATEIGIFEHRKDRWALIARIELVEKMEHDDQAAFFAELVTMFEVEEVGVDTTEGEGRAIVRALETEERYAHCRGKIVRYNAQEKLVSGYSVDEANHTVLEVEDFQRDIGTMTLRSMFRHHGFVFPADDQITSEFNREVEYRTDTGRTLIRTPKDAHCPDMLRVFGLMEFLAHPPVRPDLETGEDEEDFVLPQWGSALGTRAPLTMKG